MCVCVFVCEGGACFQMWAAGERRERASRQAGRWAGWQVNEEVKLAAREQENGKGEKNWRARKETNMEARK